MKRSALLGLLLALTAAQAAPPVVASTPVTVRFESLYWVRAQSAQPTLRQGHVLVPLLETCDLLGLKCVPDGATYAVDGERLPIVQELDSPVVLIPLTHLARLAGQQVRWDAPSKTAIVSGGSGTQGWRLIRQELSERTSPGEAHYTGTLRSSWGAIQKGVPTIPLTVQANIPLNEMTFFAHWQNQTTIIGSLTSSTPDIPNTFKGCQGQTSCTLPVPRDALWVLAYLTAKR